MGQETLIYAIGALVITKMVWEFIRNLRKPTEREVEKIAKLETRVSELEIKIDKKVDETLWQERSDKFDVMFESILDKLRSIEKRSNVK